MKNKVKALKMRFLWTIISVLVCGFTMLNLSSCATEAKDGYGGGSFANTPSGYTFDLNNESAVDIDQSFTFGKEKNGYIDSADVKITVSGNQELSYFDAAITFIWTYEALDDETGGYVEKEYVATVELGAGGNGQLSEKIEILGCRAWKNLELDLEFEGYAVRK